MCGADSISSSPFWTNSSFTPCTSWARPRQDQDQGQTPATKKKKSRKSKEQRRSAALAATIPFAWGLGWGHGVAFNFGCSPTSECHLGVEIIKGEQRHPGGLLKHTGQHSQTNTARRRPGRAWRRHAPRSSSSKFFKQKVQAMLRPSDCPTKWRRARAVHFFFFIFKCITSPVKGVFSCMAAKWQISLQLRKHDLVFCRARRVKVGLRCSRWLALRVWTRAMFCVCPLKFSVKLNYDKNANYEQRPATAVQREA